MHQQNFGERLTVKQEATKKEPKFPFERASVCHQQIIFDWLTKPHIMEFWDNSPEHKDDILNFIYGRRQTYISGATNYWVGFCDDQPFSFVLSDEIRADEPDLPIVYRSNFSKLGTAVSLDFGIGELRFLGKWLAAPALIAFMSFYRSSVNEQADTFFIDPDLNNPRARHVYEKAGFGLVGSYAPQKGAFVGCQSNLLVKKFDCIKK